MHAIVSMAHSAVSFRFLSPFPVKLYPGKCLNLLSYMNTKLSRPVNSQRNIHTRHAGHSRVSGYWYTQVLRTICVPFARLAASGIASGCLSCRKTGKSSSGRDRPRSSQINDRGSGHGNRDEEHKTPDGKRNRRPEGN